MNMISFIKLIILITLSLSQSIFSTECITKDKYPIWFLTPTEPGVVGFDIANKGSKADAVDRFCSYKKMRAKGFVRFYESGKSHNQQDSISFFYILDTSITSDKLIRNSSVNFLGGYASHFSLDSIDELNTQEISPCDIPKWGGADELVDRVYGYGISEFRYYDRLGSWVRSESDALKDLLRRSAREIVSSQKDSYGGKLEEVSKIRYDVEVSNIKVERRFVELFGSKKQAVVVVSVLESDIISILESKNSQISDSLIKIFLPNETVEDENVESDKLYEEYRELKRMNPLEDMN
jgi:hypothetical protein